MFGMWLGRNSMGL